MDPADSFGHRTAVRVLKELDVACAKFPSFHSPREGFAVLKEEVDELWEEVRKGAKVRMREEAIQVAAMAIRFIEDCA